jgi:hypothetical protein
MQNHISGMEAALMQHVIIQLKNERTWCELWDTTSYEQPEDCQKDTYTSQFISIAKTRTSKS